MRFEGYWKEYSKKGEVSIKRKLKKKGEDLSVKYEWYEQQYVNKKGEKVIRKVWRNKGSKKGRAEDEWYWREFVNKKGQKTIKKLLRKKGQKFGEKYEWYKQSYVDENSNKRIRRVLREKPNQFTRKGKPSFEGRWEWYWEEYIDSKGHKRYRKKYRKQPTQKDKLGLGDKEYDYYTNDFYNSANYVGWNENVVNVPLAKNRKQLNSGYGDTRSRTYYKLVGSKKVTTFPFPLPSV